MARWTRAQVEQFAPDDKSIKAALKLAKPGPWSETGSTEALVWGKCQGSGKTPYQVSVDLTGPAAKCTCPSRKFPCKHGIALLMLWVAGDGTIGETTQAADFASEWAQGRSDRAAKKSAKSNTPPDPEAAAKRLEKRLTLMSAGIDEFETWLTDLYRNGFAAARQQPYSFWEQPAARLLDAQLPGLAQRVRDTPSLLYADDWADELLAETGRWFIAVRSWQRRTELSEADVANLRVFLGWPIPTDEVKQAERIDDTWIVQGLHRTDDGRLKSQRTWILGATTGTQAVLLDFAGGGAFLEAGHVVGSQVTGGLARYPGSGVRRALFPDDPTPAGSSSTVGAATSIAEASGVVAGLLAENPFVDQHPVCLRVRVSVDGELFRVIDQHGDWLRLDGPADPWRLLALCGDDDVAVFGERYRNRFRPLSVEVDGELMPL